MSFQSRYDDSERDLTGVLGNGQDEFRAWELVPGVGTGLPELTGREAGLKGDSPPSPQLTKEQRRLSESRKTPLASIANVSPRAEAFRSLSFFGETPLTRQSVVQLPYPPSGEAITFGGKSVERTPYRGRITGPVKFLKLLLKAWHLDTNSACTLLGFEPADSAYIHDVLGGYATLRGRDAKDRISHLFQIRSSLSALFNDETVENEWLRERQEVLNEKTPMELLQEGSMENLLLVMEFVDLVAGR